MSIEEAYRALVDRERIRDVIGAYCLSLDDGDLPGVARCFAVDATADYGPGRGGPLNGALAIVARIALGQTVFRRTHHQLGQIRVDVDRDTAHSVRYVTAWHERFSGEREIACLRYIDTLRQVDSCWLINARRVEAAYVEGFPETPWVWVERLRS